LINLVSFDAPFTPVGTGVYYFTFNATSTSGEVLNITDKETWRFEISTGQFKNTQFKNNQFKTN